jgi:hypothetical protein
MEIENYRKFVALRAKLDDVSIVLDVWASPTSNFTSMETELRLIKERLTQEVDSIKKVLEENKLTF